MIPIDDLCGIVTVLNTPFTKDGELDYESLAHHAEYAAHYGVKGFLLPAMASEVYSLKPEERTLMLKTVRAAAPSHIIIGGASAPTHEETLSFAQSCIKSGCDGILVSIGRDQESELLQRLLDLEKLKPNFIMLQDWDAEGDGLSDKSILDAFEKVEAFKCIKIEVANAGAKYTRLLHASGRALHVSGGWAVTQMLDGLDRGVHAFMPTGMHATYVRIYTLFQQGKKEEAQALFDRLSPILEFSNQDLEWSILFFKHLLHEQGIYETALVRPPIEPWDEEERDEADEFIHMAIELEDESLNSFSVEATSSSL